MGTHNEQHYDAPCGHCMTPETYEKQRATPEVEEIVDRLGVTEHRAIGFVKVIPVEELRTTLTTLTTKHQEELEKAVEVALNKGYTKALREIDIGSYDYVKSRRKIAELSGVPMMAITYDEHVDVIREKY